MDFKERYNRKTFLGFLENQFLPDDFDIHIEKLDIEFKTQFIKKVALLGDVDSLSLKVYEIEHISEHDPRVSLSKETFKLMANYGSRRALVFFVSPKSENYRFSLINIDLKLEGKRVTKEYTNPRRYSFYLGPDAKTHTPEDFLIKRGRTKDFEDLFSRFNVEVVTKEFFQELSNWYFWAIENVQFPKSEEIKNNGQNIAVIRLITRLIFIWFMKQKELVPDYLFNKSKIEEILVDLSNDESTYYRAILQNLFFATLNTSIKKRRFREKKNYERINKDYAKHEFYRYEEYFRDPSQILQLFKGIPFLNGGLFECLDKKREKIIIDGFSRVKRNQPIVPNFLFFSDEQLVDLNKKYGTKNKIYKVEGLINILQRYNFTIDENTPADVEIALDPELLGRVFENLLASYNPETATTARKATGSYYTPREIVNYMVEESLKVYFKTKLGQIKNIDQDLEELFSYDIETHGFNEGKVKILIEAINSLKIIDPAVGSGAFPMGILQKLVYILSKIDPHNELWKQEQIKAVEKNVLDAVLKRDLIKKIESNFENNELDYGRKLYLIQNCIYGVDIQPIAIQITKLRFFISLLVDENVNKNLDNMGIDPLPNLETKFVAANSLIGLQLNGQMTLKDPCIQQLEDKLKQVRIKYFSANYSNEKRKLREEDENIRLQLAELLKQGGFSVEGTDKIINWDPYNLNTSSNWFNSEWMFGIKSGFDIVIANPPYIASYGRHAKRFDKNDVEYFIKKYKTFAIISNRKNVSINTVMLFLEQGLRILKNKGILAYITDQALLNIDVYHFSREYLIKNYSIKQIVSDLKFPQVIAEMCILLVENKIPKDNHFFTWKKKEGESPSQRMNIFDISQNGYVFSLSLFDRTLKKIEENSKLLKDCTETFTGMQIIPEYFLSNNNEVINLPKWHKAVFSKNIKRYKIIWPAEKQKGKYITYDTELQSRVRKELQKKIDSGEKCRKPETLSIGNKEKEYRFFTPKIILSQTVNRTNRRIKLQAALDDKVGYYGNVSIHLIRHKNLNYLKFLLANLNSTLISFYAVEKKLILGSESGSKKTPQIRKGSMDRIPIKDISMNDQKPFINLVDKILAITKDKDYLQNENKQKKVKEYEDQIDGLVYKLYDLNLEEIKIIKNFNKR